MSRIHEALKRAEKERMAGSRPEASPRADQNSSEGTLHRERLPGPTGAGLAVPDQGGMEESPNPLAFEAWLANCPPTPWTPDPKKVLFPASHDHPLGGEEFRTLRSQLLHFRDAQPLRTLLVTSPLPQEGKTFVAANLAHSIVRQRERRVLLIDADLRWSRLHLSLGAPSTPGLSEYLRGSANEQAILQRGSLENLFFIPGGATAPNAAELLANGRLKGLLQRLAANFDWIIVDSPPAIPVSDAGLLAVMCDGVLMVVAAGRTPFDLAQKVRQQFRDKQLLGVVLNRAERGSSYGSFYRYSYPDKNPKNGKNRG